MGNQNGGDPVTNSNEIKCNQCKGTLLQIGTATSIKRNESVKIHEYHGKHMENANEFWVVDRLTDFENVSVSRPVSFGNDKEINHIISTLLNGEISNNLQLRYLMCSGPPMDLSALFGGNANKAQKQNLQKLLTAPQICEKLIIGAAVFEGKDYK